MDQLDHAETLKTIAAEVFAALGSTTQVPPFSSRASENSHSPGLSVDDAYRVTPLVRQMYEARGARAIGRKIGFTNRTIWPQYGVYAPIWGHVFDRTVHDLADVETLALAPFSEPRIEPEIVFGLAAAPSAEMDETALLSCIAWVALGFEIVQSIFPDWKFSAADTVAANGLHGALLIGPRHPPLQSSAEWQRQLSTFAIDLHCDGEPVDHGHAVNVLGGPLAALRHLVGLLASASCNPPLASGEIVTTGTLTRAMPVAAGEVWTAVPAGIALDAIRLGFS